MTSVTNRTSTPSASRNPNIIWITLDSVRADHTSINGYKRDTTPELSRILSEGGVNFEHAIAHSSRTPISVPSMLTGMYPSRHRMLGTQSSAHIPEEMDTAPELLSDIGYQTVAVSENNYAGAAKGIDKRFDDFTKSSPFSLCDFLSPQLGRSVLKYPMYLREHGPGFTFDISAHGKQNSFFTLDIAKRKLKTAAKQDNPVFCYVHFDDPHLPYIPPRAYEDTFLRQGMPDGGEATDLANDVHENIDKLIAEGLPLSGRELQTLIAMYDSCIRYTDKCVGAFVDYIRSVLDDVIIVITADHGDLLGERDLLGHYPVGTVLHDALVHVPLLVTGLSEISRHKESPTQHIDVMQTILEYAGADTSQFQGVDLRTETRDVAISQEHLESVADDSIKNYKSLFEHNPEFDSSDLPQSKVTAARTTEFKLVQTDNWCELYTLPDEQTDSSEKYDETYAKLSEYLNDWKETEGVPFEAEPEKASLDRKTKQHLEEMGYLT